MLYAGDLVLCPLEDGDVNEMMKYINDVEMNAYLSRVFPITREDEKEWIRSVNADRSKVIFAIKKLSSLSSVYELIGTCGLSDINLLNRFATFGIQIFRKDFWGQGWGVKATKLLLDYAFKEIGLNRITSWVISYNKRSVSLHERVGFVVEGAQRNCIYRKGSYHSLILFGLLRDEYLGLADKKKSTPDPPPF